VGSRSRCRVTEYNQGTVIVEVIDPATKQVLWRGRGVSAVSDDAGNYQTEVRKAVEAILDKFPRAASRVGG
jgi:hypothetical protein